LAFDLLIVSLISPDKDHLNKPSLIIEKHKYLDKTLFKTRMSIALF